MDETAYKYEIMELTKKLNMMSEQVKTYEDRINALVAERDLLSKKLDSAAQDSANIRKIMTDNITSSNVERQNLLSENQILKSKLKELEA